MIYVMITILINLTLNEVVDMWSEFDLTSKS